MEFLGHKELLLKKYNRLKNRAHREIRDTRLLMDRRRQGKNSYHKSVSTPIHLLLEKGHPEKVATLLVPRHLIKRIKKGNFSRQFTRTVTSQRSLLKSSRRLNANSSNTKYQKPRGPNCYVKINFRPKAEDWAQLRSLAISHGVSMCLLFTILFEASLLEKKEESELRLRQIKSSLYLNLTKKIFYRELWINELQKPTLAIRSGPKIA